MKKIVVTFNCNYEGTWWEEVQEYEVEENVDATEFVTNLNNQVSSNLEDYRVNIISAYVIIKVIW